MIDHVSIGVRDLEGAIRFYDAVTGPLGSIRLWRTSSAAGYGPPRGDDRLAIFASGKAAPAGVGTHLAFTAMTPEAVDQFHKAALGTGGTDDGAPGFRERYGPGYYAAFVRDPNGNKLEAVWHMPTAAGRRIAEVGD